MISAQPEQVRVGGQVLGPAARGQEGKHGGNPAGRERSPLGGRHAEQDTWGQAPRIFTIRGKRTRHVQLLC
jgi:hypothetical protein